MEQKKQAAGAENIYRLDGRVPLQKAIPFGLQHVLAMFVANLAPVLIVCSAVVVRGTGEHLNPAEITGLLQCAMFTAGLGTCMQLYPVWKIGSKLPIVMGISFTFVGSLLTIGTNPALGYEGMVGAVILGGIFEGLVGLSARYWKRFVTPVVSACVVIAIGLSLLSVGMDSWGGGTGAGDFGAWYHLLVGGFTLVVCLVANYRLKGIYKNLNILIGLIFGYLLSVILTAAGVAPLIDFSGISQTVQEVGFFSLPKLVFFTEHRPVFDLGALVLILASLFPPLGAFFNSLPQAVLGGCTVMMFGSIMYEGIKMLKECEFDDRTMIIVSLAFCIGVGLPQTSGNFFAAFPPAVGEVFNGNAVAGVFVVALFLSLVLPKRKD
ncbi:MAG: hypothetical protein KH128_05995 [Firmicutes bacterium]|nr:hypothetical protein [Bacillota bacterium]